MKDQNKTKASLIAELNEMRRRMARLEKNQTEEAGAEDHDKFRRYIENSPGALFVCDGDCRLLDVNRISCQLTGYSREELLAKTFADLVTPESVEEMRKAFDRLKETGEVESEILIRKKDGTRFHSSLDAVSLSDGNVMAFCFDISKRKQAEEELQETKDLLEGILNVIPDVIGVQERDHTIVRYNEAGYAFLNMEPEDTHGKKCYELIGRHFPCEVCATSKSYKSKKPEKIEKYTGQLDTWLDVRSYPILNENGKVVKVVEHLRDITERKRAEKEKARLEDQYRQVMKVEAIGRLAGGVAHDLNNMLSPILGYGEMLLGDMASDDKRRTVVDDIIRAGFRARDLVRQLLAFSRKQTLEYKPVNMNEVVSEFEKLLRRTIREDIAIEIVPEADILTVMADVGQIEQVIMNLAVNAQDAMPEGGVLTIQTAMAELDDASVAIHRDLQAGEYVMLVISDTGQGMDEDTTKHLFEPFFSTKGEQGTGLGLATVYGIIKQHGGSIWVYSEPDEGTTFKIYLPVTEKVRVEENAARRSVSDLRGSETIMLVEDNEQVRRLAHEILKRQGYAVLVAGSGLQALEMMGLHRGPVHLLFTDVVLPGMNGRDLYIKAAENQPNLRVLYMSGYIDEVIAHRGVLEEGVAFIQKPFTVRALTEKVREVLDQTPPSK